VISQQLSLDRVDWSQCRDVESVPGRVSGALVLRGTRMPVSVLLDNLMAGATVDELLEWFDGLNRAQVQRVVEFAVRSANAPAGFP
jgi:uncharacterized protein (DUF433 family)